VLIDLLLGAFAADWVRGIAMGRPFSEDDFTALVIIDAFNRSCFQIKYLE
jgi:hypothetical protein